MVSFIYKIEKGGNNELETKLKKLRLKKRMTQDEIANELGISRQAYSAYESGKNKPNVERLQGIASALGVSVDYFISDKDPLISDIEYALSDESPFSAVEKSHLRHMLQFAIEYIQIEGVDNE